MTPTPARLLLNRIMDKVREVNCNNGIYGSDEIESLLQAEIDQASREFGIKVTGDMHKDMYWQAGEIDRLTRALAQAKKEACEDAAKMADGFCYCDGTGLDPECNGCRIAIKLREKVGQ